MLYDMGHLKKYPMGLGCLGELEEAKPNPNRPSCERLYQESIKSATTYYKNHQYDKYIFEAKNYFNIDYFTVFILTHSKVVTTIDRRSIERRSMLGPMPAMS